MNNNSFCTCEKLNDKWIHLIECMPDKDYQELQNIQNLQRWGTHTLCGLSVREVKIQSTFLREDILNHHLITLFCPGCLEAIRA